MWHNNFANDIGKPKATREAANRANKRSQPSAARPFFAQAGYNRSPFFVPNLRNPSVSDQETSRDLPSNAQAVDTVALKSDRTASPQQPVPHRNKMSAPASIPTRQARAVVQAVPVAERFFQPAPAIAKATIHTKRDSESGEEVIERTSADTDFTTETKQYASGEVPLPPAEQNDSGIQTKLVVGAVDSENERNADRFADHVMRMAESKNNVQDTAASQPSPLAFSAPANVFAQGAPGGLNVDPAIGADLRSSKGSGLPLPTASQQKLEGASGRDLSTIRVHDDPRADKMARNLNAKAFTHGRDIYFKQGQYQPHTTDGQHLLAHEVGHIVGGHTGIHRHIDDYDVVTLGTFGTVAALARSYGLKTADIVALNEKAYREEYGRTFNPRMLFPNSRIFLPRGTIPFHSNQEAMAVDLRTVTVKNKHIDDPLYPGTMREYELRYLVIERDSEETNVTSFALAVRQKLDILLDSGAQFTMTIQAATALPSFNVEREKMSRKQLSEWWLKQSVLTGGLRIDIQSETFNQDPVDLTHYETTVTVFTSGAKGRSIQQEHSTAGSAFSNLESSIEEKYRAALQLVRRKIDYSSYSVIDYKNRLDGDIYYTQRAAYQVLSKLKDFPGDGVISKTRDGRYRVVPLTQADMSFIADYLRNGDNPYVSTQRLWWVKEDIGLQDILYDGYIDYYPANLKKLFFRTFQDAWKDAETHTDYRAAVFFTHTNGFYGWITQSSAYIEKALDHAVENLPPGATFDGHFTLQLTNNANSAVVPLKAWGLRSGKQLHLIDQDYFEGRDIWLNNKAAFGADTETNPIVEFIDKNPVKGRKLHRYLQVELDRSRDVTKNLAAELKPESAEQLAENVRFYGVSQIYAWSRNKALEIIDTSIDRLTTLKSGRDALHSYLLSYMQLKQNREKVLFFEAMGLDDSERAQALAVFEDKKKYYSVLLGNTADGVSLEWFQQIIGKTFSELRIFKRDVKTDETIPIEMAGGFGETIRTATYEHFGFALKTAEYPHEREAKYGGAIRPGKGIGGFRTLREQQWITYSAYKARKKRQRDYLIRPLSMNGTENRDRPS